MRGASRARNQNSKYCKEEGFMSNSPRLALPYIVSGQAQKEVTHNDALNGLDSLAQIGVLSATLDTPPGSPAEGDSYIIGSSPTGAWAGHAGKVASYYSGWQIRTPREGWLAWVADTDGFVAHDGSNWTAFRVSVPAGSAAAPALAISGDADTGVYAPGADVLALAAGGKDAARFNAASGAVNYLDVTPSATGANIALGASGSDSDIGLTLSPKGTGLLKMGNSASFTANGSVATALTSVGPAGANTAVQEWLTIKNSAGVTRYIPCF